MLELESMTPRRERDAKALIVTFALIVLGLCQMRTDSKLDELRRALHMAKQETAALRVELGAIKQKPR